MTWVLLTEEKKDALFYDFLHRGADKKDLVKWVNDTILADYEGWNENDFYYNARNSYIEVLEFEGTVIRDLNGNFMIKEWS